ncbi:MAG: leucine-rich repeat protein [Lachnospiraceae bacterium]|jgi:fibronectin type III domain|nr:leucine-rich repeat protein [Lachnospiraceae bacterium]
MNLSFKKCILFAISLLMGIGCMGQKAGARDDVGRYEPSIVDYAVPSSNESEWIKDGIYEYSLIRNKTAVRLMVLDTSSAKEFIVPKVFHNLPVKELFYVRGKKWEHLIVPNGIEIIDDSALSGMSHLRKVDLGKDVQYIGRQAFWGNPNLTEVTGGQNVRFVGRQVFYLCKRMKNLPDFMKNHRKCIYSQAAFKNARALTNIKLSSNVQYTNALFKGCTSLKSAYIQGKGFLPNAKTWKYMNKNKINEEMFSGCRSLKTVKLYNGITRLNARMFADCVKLQKVNIPKKCTYIGINTFRNCKSLRKLTISKSVKKIDKTAFRGCKKLTLYVKKGSYAHKYAKKYHIKYKLVK